MSVNFSVGIPTLDEAENIDPLLNRLLANRVAQGYKGLQSAQVVGAAEGS